MLKNKSSIELKAVIKKTGNRSEISINSSAISDTGKKPAIMDILYPNVDDFLKDMIVKELLIYINKINGEADANDMMTEKGSKSTINFIMSDLDYGELLAAERELILFLLSLNDKAGAMFEGYKSA